MAPIVTLLTDFGLGDPFVGIMKGVILGRAPGARIVDLTHGIPPQDVRAAAYWLARSYRWFPEGTVHVAVVDPGVGSDRAAIVARAHGHTFVAPDNGLLWDVLAREPHAEVRRIDPPALGLVVASHTFHGRDVFAPVGAELASGRLDFDRVGPTLANPVAAEWAAPERDGDVVRGRIVCCDHFGNLISDIDRALVVDLGDVRVSIAGRDLRLHRTYADVAPGAALALINAFDSLEIAVRDGDAAATLGVKPGAAVEVRGARAPGRV